MTIKVIQWSASSVDIMRSKWRQEDTFSSTSQFKSIVLKSQSEGEFLYVVVKRGYGSDGGPALSNVQATK